MRGCRLAFVSLLAAAVALASCDDESEQGPPDQTYTTRGAVRYVPSGDDNRPQLVIEHEAIESFVNREGEKVGMKPMMMSFTPGEDVSLDALSAGDKVEFTFEVRWDAKPTMKVVAIEKLPAGTKLELPKGKGKGTGKGTGTGGEGEPDGGS